MTLGVYLVGIGAILVAFTVSRLPHSLAQVVATLRPALRIMADDQIDDSDKERAARHAAVRMLAQTVIISLKLAVTLFAGVLPFWMADRLALVSWQDSLAFASRWDVLGVTTVVMIGGWLAWGSVSAHRS